MCKPAADGLWTVTEIWGAALDQTLNPKHPKLNPKLYTPEHIHSLDNIN